MTRIKDILNERNISLKEFAAELGISYTALYLQINKQNSKQKNIKKRTYRI